MDRIQSERNELALIVLKQIEASVTQGFRIDHTLVECLNLLAGPDEGLYGELADVITKIPPQDTPLFNLAKEKVKKPELNAFEQWEKDMKIMGGVRESYEREHGEKAAQAIDDLAEKLKGSEDPHFYAFGEEGKDFPFPLGDQIPRGYEVWDGFRRYFEGDLLPEKFKSSTVGVVRKGKQYNIALDLKEMEVLLLVITLCTGSLENSRKGILNNVWRKLEEIDIKSNLKMIKNIWTTYDWAEGTINFKEQKSDI